MSALLGAACLGGLVSEASAATVDVSDFGGSGIPIVSVAMGDRVSTLTLSTDPGGAKRIHEDGDALSLVGAPVVGGCTQPVIPGDIVCTAPTFVSWTISNSGGSIAPPDRDILVATSFTGQTFNVSSATLMEAFLPDAPAPTPPMFNGSDIVAGTPAVPADIVHVGSGGLRVNSTMGGGADLVVGSTGAVNVNGGNGADTLIGSSVHDVLDGGGDNDLVRGGLGADTLSPGPGFADVVSYDDAGRGAPLTATFTSGATFPQNPDGDTVNTGFEGLEGTPLGDNLTAGASGAELRGAEGDDVLQGGPGIDTFAAGDGSDDVRAADGNAESVDCGDGFDVNFSVDASDILSGCEGTASLAPPAAVPTTAAGTTVARPPAGSQTSASSLPRIGATLTAAFGLRGASTVVTALTVKKLPKGATVTVTCTAPKGRASACAFKTKTRRFTKATTSSAFAGLFKKRRLPAATKVGVRISAPGTTAKTFTYTTRKRKQPKLVSF